MAKSQVSISLQLGSVAGRDFQEFWHKEVLAGRIPPNFEVSFDSGGSPPAGLGLAAVSTVLIALATGAASQIGKHIADLLWDAIKRFWESHSKAVLPSEITIFKADIRLTVTALELTGSDRPPEALVKMLE